MSVSFTPRDCDRPIGADLHANSENRGPERQETQIAAGHPPMTKDEAIAALQQALQAVLETERPTSQVSYMGRRDIYTRAQRVLNATEGLGWLVFNDGGGR